MAFVLTEEQQFLRESARDLLKSAPVSLIRELRDSRDEKGYSEQLWNSMIEMGWQGIAVKEEFGGLDFGLRSQGLVFEELGRSLSSSPLLSAVVSYQVLQKFGSEAQKERLNAMMENGALAAICIQEGEHYKTNSYASEASMSPMGYNLNGSKDFVADGHVASAFITVAHGPNGDTVFLVDANSDGIEIDKEFMMDSRYYSRVTFTNVAVQKANIIGEEGQAKKIVNFINNLSNALLSAELVGIMTEAFDRTVDYLKERRQFDQAIGSFQALQHRAADLYGEIEIAKSLSIKALDALDEDNALSPAFCSMAKAKCIKVAQTTTNEGIQMFGGIGMTDDEEIGFFLKRARVAAQQFGGYSYHLNRFARLSGY